MATASYVPRVAELVEQFDGARVQDQATTVIELYNVQQYLEHNFLPTDYTEEDKAMAKSKIQQIESVVARFFSSVNDANCATFVKEVDHEYHSDLLNLLGRYGAFDRCSGSVMLSALEHIGTHLGEMLGCKKLVVAYDVEMRHALLESPRNAEYLIRKHLQKNTQEELHLPRSLGREEARQLLERYIDSPDANMNYVNLIESAAVSAHTGVDAKLKLRARRRGEQLTAALFENNAGLRTGTEVAISDVQDEPLKFEMDKSDGLVAKFSYSRRWLDETADNPSILNNFQHLFEFADAHVLLHLPSYAAHLGIFERYLATVGRSHYQVGAAFNAIDGSSLLQTRMYEHYLEDRQTSLEAVIAWFFERYLADEFGAFNFSYRPSSSGASYLERVRHVFAEMESTLTQFTLFVENGELDRELLAITSDLVRYKGVPSLLSGKYVYPTDNVEVVGILHAIFSDQSTIHHINDDLSGSNAVDLLRNNIVAYGDFHEYQKPDIDLLIAFGILEDTGARVRFASADRLFILQSLFSMEACSYYHLPSRGRAEVDAMVERGWVERRACLLTEAEGDYFNYCLNGVDFTNGPALRNKYLHGTQADRDGEDAHFEAYITALKLMVALVIKINDDFCLSMDESSRT